jgi:rod shape-determining protein MreC
MNRSRYSNSYAQASHRSAMTRAWMVLLIITGVTLLVLARSHHPVVTRLRAQMLDIVHPAIATLTQPVAGMRSLLAYKHDMLNAMAENAQLRTENDTLRHWQAVAQALKAENDALRQLSGYQPVEHVSYVTGRVIGQSPSAYAGALLINAGSSEGIKPLQPVVDAQGLVGRITDVGNTTSRVLLLTDPSSRVPVISATSRQHAILAGTGDALMQLTFIGGDPQGIALGETIVTTEEGGLIPGGIMIGTVFRRDATGLLVKPLRPLADSEYMRVIVSN